MRTTLLSCFCLVALVDVAIGESTFVPAALPVYVNGVAVPPRNGGHLVTLDREKGIQIDGTTYLGVVEYPPFVAPVRSDGMPYAVHGAQLAAADAINAGGDREQAKEAMLAFWHEQFGAELLVKAHGDAEYEITYHGRSVWVPVPKNGNYHPERRASDNYQALKLAFDDVVASIRTGMLVLCGQTYVRMIDAIDAEPAMSELNSLSTRAKVQTTIRGEPVYAPMDLVGGKYALTGFQVRDFVAADGRR